MRKLSEAPAIHVRAQVPQRTKQDVNILANDLNDTLCTGLLGFGVHPGEVFLPELQGTWVAPSSGVVLMRSKRHLKLLDPISKRSLD